MGNDRTTGVTLSDYKIVIFRNPHMSYSLESRLLVSPSIAPLTVSYITPYITLFQEFRP